MSKTKRPSPSKYFCFTLNNPTDFETKAIHHGLHENCSYFIYGKEVGESGTPHLQGYFEMRKRSRLTTAKAILVNRVHLEVRKGTSTQAADYCKKDGDFTEHGKISKGRGSRSDLAAVKSALDSGASVTDISESHFGQWCRYRKAFHEYRLQKVKRNWPCHILWLTGPSGSGKSRFAFENHPDAYYKSSGKWWDGYAGQDVVVFDDFRADWCTYSTLLRWADRYPCLVETKGSTAPLLAKLIIITSVQTPEETFPKRYDRQLERRIKEVKHFTPNIVLKKIDGKWVPK